MKSAYYFDHDYNARNDQKILELRAEHGWAGYGIYFAILESLCESGGYIKRQALAGLSLGLSMDKKSLSDFIEFCISVNLLDENENGIFSKRIHQHLEYRIKLSDAGKRGGRGNKAVTENDKATLKPPFSHPKATPEARKERKEKEIKEEYYSFAQFWDDYDKKEGLKLCKVKWLKISDEDKVKIKDHVVKYVKSTPEVKFRKNPLTYLNSECWNDEIIDKTKNITPVQKLASEMTSEEFFQKYGVTRVTDYLASAKSS